MHCRSVHIVVRGKQLPSPPPAPPPPAGGNGEPPSASGFDFRPTLRSLPEIPGIPESPEHADSACARFLHQRCCHHGDDGETLTGQLGAARPRSPIFRRGYARRLWTLIDRGAQTSTVGEHPRSPSPLGGQP